MALKLNPVNDYLGPIYSEIFADFIDRGFLRIFYGGSEAGAAIFNSDMSAHATRNRPSISTNLSQGEDAEDIAPSRSPNAEWIVFASNRDGSSGR